jgi:hypothetical protein
MPEKRIYPRVRVMIPVCCTAAGFRAVSGLATDVSLGGVCVQSEEAFPFGTKITVVTRFPGVPYESRLPGSVRWTRSGCFGVQFGSLRGRDASCIADLMRGALRSHVRRLREENSPSSAPASHIRSIKQHCDPVAPTAPESGWVKQK